MRPLESSWEPFAIFQVRSKGFDFPDQFPKDFDIFPFRRWVTTVINCGDSDIAMNASWHTEEYIRGNLFLFKYLSKMLDIARTYSIDCSIDHIEMNMRVSKAILFALNASLLDRKKER
jgi:hypothetical protein